MALLGADPALEGLKSFLIERTEGNPFFLEESIRTLVESQLLAGERGAYRLAKTLPTIQVPATVQTVLAARIDRLPPEQKAILQTAAAIGKDVPFSLLQALTEKPEEDLRHGLAHLQAAEFLYEASLFPDPEYTFKHALTHDVAYGSLLKERRRALHARIVEAIERLCPDRLTQHVERLAYHAFRGEVWDKAVLYLRQAGAKAFAHAANREATTCFEQALAALGHLPKTHDTLGQAIDLRFDLRNPLQTLGEMDRVIEHLRDAEGLAQGLDDQRRLGWVSAYMSGHFWMTGHPTRARARAEAARAIAGTLGDFALLVAANNFLSQATLTLGDYRRAEDFAREVTQSLEGHRTRERCGLAGFPVVLARTWLAWSLAERGEFEAAMVCGWEGIRLAEALDHAYSLMWACVSLGNAYAVKGEIAEAIRLLERGRALSRDRSLGVWASTLTAYLGYLHAMSGHLAEGVALLSESLSAMDAMGSSSFRSLLEVRLGEAHLLADHPEEALAVAEGALARASERDERGHEAHALHLLGEIAARRDPPRREDAEGHYRRAVSIADELGMRPLVAHCHLGLGKLYRRVGKREGAGEYLATSTTMYREMEMRLWLEQAELAMTELA